MSDAPQLVLVRHGQSTWNKAKRFTGWENPPLTALGRREADRIGLALTNANMCFDIAHTSYLSRAIETLWRIQKSMDLMWIPTRTDWRLNERHYGALQGLNKIKMQEQYGEAQVQQWRRSYEISPPLGGNTPAPDHRYRNVRTPQSESLAATRKRAVAYFRARIMPDLKRGKRVLVVAHGNLLRALMMHIENISPNNISKVQIDTAHAVVYSRVDAEGMPKPPRRVIAPV